MSTRIGILGSSGGSAFAAAETIVARALPERFSFHVLTDRPCGLEVFAAGRGLPHERIGGGDNESLSRQAAERFAQAEVDLVLLFYARLVTPSLFDRLPTLNIHPALLPAFIGMGAVRKAHELRVRFLGATLHQVDATLDGGPIVAQTVMPIDPDEPRERLEKYSYLQKVHLTLLLFDLIDRGHLSWDGAGMLLSPGVAFGDRSNPCIEGAAIIAAFRTLQEGEGAVVVP